MNLNFYQKLAAYQSNPYSIIIAGAGTGKTHTLLERIHYLIHVVGLQPEEILVISFTNETVLDFEKKWHALYQEPITVLTFHKLAIYLLKLANKNYQLCDINILSDITKEFIENYCSKNAILNMHLRKTQPFFQYLFSKNHIELGRNLQKTLIQFLSLCRSKNIKSEDIKNLYYRFHGRRRHFFLLAYVLACLYSSEKASQSLLDFDDLVIEATAAISSISFRDFPFKHILVDEFQDSSLVRILLIKNLIQQFRMEFTVVGDDCQSIYRFSGTENNCFSLLQSFFPNMHYFFLKQTYRNSQELAFVANCFIQKNPNQIKKEIFSEIHMQNPIQIVFYHKASFIYKFIQSIIFTHQNKEILFLGRNSFDWKYYFSQNDITWIDTKHFYFKMFPKNIFSFLTVHQSKGLEADIVIILHLENSIYGFPNKIKPNIFLKSISSHDVILYEEERRLFYVALTRAKEYIYLVTPIQKPSDFVMEILNDHRKFVKTKYYF